MRVDEPTAVKREKGITKEDGIKGKKPSEKVGDKKKGRKKGRRKEQKKEQKKETIEKKKDNGVEWD